MQAAIAAAAVAALALTGCAATSATEPATSAPELAGTRWSGRDPEGDTVTFEFEQGGQLTFFSYGEESSFEDDRWTIAGETLTWQATFGFPFSTCAYVGALDTEAQVVDATYTCAGPEAPGGSIELERRADGG